MLTVLDFQKLKQAKKKISMVTCYDAWTAKILDRSPVDCLLVGDSLAMVMHSHSTTIPASVELMALHTAAVARGGKEKFIIGDLPFLSYRKGLAPAMEAVGALMAAGAHAVKLEGIHGHEEIVRHIVDSGVPVMGHLGLTPQSVHALGGMRVQARNDAAAEILLTQARRLEGAGCFAVVLECVPSEVARRVTSQLAIPTIGIGAGPHVDGQVLVLQDLLGADPGFQPKFLRRYAQISETIGSALKAFDADVKEGRFPNEKESYA